MKGTIKYLKHQEIDFIKWDNAIDKSYNGLVYAYSFYLNAMSNSRWDALVYGDYEAVFPLVWNQKFGFKYLYQPYFIQQLGLFSKHKITTDFLDKFLLAIPSKFRYWNIQLNSENVSFNHGISFINRTTYQINLQQEYINIYDNYNADAKKNIAKSTQIGFDFKVNIDLQLVSNVFFEAYGMHYPNEKLLKKQIFNCMVSALNLNKGFSRAIYGLDGQLWSVGYFFISNGYIHYAIAAPTDEGKKYAATHLLIDEVIKEFSGQKLIFDFEGSDIKSVAYFYSKFGSSAKHYIQIKRNRLPFWCRFLKKN
jgi:hypothetical protein